SYYTAFSTHDEAIGVNRVLGALVDFDRWLDCPPRSAHEDQMRLHARMSQLSGSYMLPLIGYNPWTDIVENGRSLSLVREAVTRHGFVGVKIYPANGFRPWGNTSAPDGVGLPSHAAIEGSGAWATGPSCAARRSVPSAARRRPGACKTP